jgi:hypothetical protein
MACEVTCKKIHFYCSFEQALIFAIVGTGRHSLNDWFCFSQFFDKLWNKGTEIPSLYYMLGPIIPLVISSLLHGNILLCVNKFAEY